MIFNCFKTSIKLDNFRRLSNKISKMNQCPVAVCQFTATNCKESNLKTVKKLVADAAEKNVDMAFLPEGCDFIGANKEETKSLAEPISGALVKEYKNLAKTHNIWLSIGGFHELVPNETGKSKIFNSHIIINNLGEIKSTYRKVHLFDVAIPEKNIYLRESDVTEEGYQLEAPVKTPAGLLALSICYDLRFPELSILQRKRGATILTYPSAFTNATGTLHWDVLLRARAIESQCFVIAAAQYGKHNEKRISYGHSVIIDPWGKIIAECPKYQEGQETDASIAIAEIDLASLIKLREEMPVFEHRRTDLYELQLTKPYNDLLGDNETFLFADKLILGATVFYRSEYSIAFTNIRCVVPGHVLVASRRQVKRLEELRGEEVADLFQTTVKVQSVLERAFGADSATICVQDGKSAGQTVMHVHVHILPRKANDFERNDVVYEKLAEHDRDSNAAIRSTQEMSEEAQNLRKFFL